MNPPALIIVTGPPAAGKTTIARELAERLSLPLLEQDGIKEVLHDTMGSGDRDRSREDSSRAVGGPSPCPAP